MIELVNEMMISGGVLLNVVTYKTLVDWFCNEDNFCKANDDVGYMLKKWLLLHIKHLTASFYKHKMVEVTSVLYEMGKRGFSPEVKHNIMGTTQSKPSN